MLLFRSEEHVRRWRAAWEQPSGSTLSLSQIWALARAWYGDDRRLPGWRRKTVDEAQAIFAALGLVTPFWKF